MGTGLLLLSSYVLLALGLLVNFGFYHPVALTLLAASFAMLVTAFLWAARRSVRDRKIPGTPIFAIALLVLLIAAMTQPAALYVQTPPWEVLYHWWLVVLGALIALFYVALRANTRGIRRALFIAAVVIAIAFRIWLPSALPTPVIDTYSLSQEASQHLRDGKNPYSAPVSDVYQEQASVYGYSLKAYVYLPANLYAQFVSYLPTGDIRYVYVLAELVAAFAIWRLSSRRWNESTAECLALLFLYNPRSMYVIQQGWVDPLILMFFGVFMLLRDRAKPGPASLAYGYMLFLKQYMVFALVQWFIIERDRKRILAGLGLGILTMIPFILLDWRAFMDNGILFNVLIPFRSDSLTIFSLLSQSLGLQPPPGWAVFVGALLTVLTYIPQRHIQPLRGYLFALTITLYGMFLFGTSGFCNWYYLVCGFLIFLLAAGGRSTENSKSFDEMGFALMNAPQAAAGSASVGTRTRSRSGSRRGARR